MNKQDKILSRFEEVAKVKDYVETSNPLKIAMDLIEKDLQIENLKSELESLKKNAIVSKFKVGEEVWVIDDLFGNDVYNTKIKSIKFDGKELLYEVSCLPYMKGENEIYKTPVEAEEALKRLEE